MRADLALLCLLRERINDNTLETARGAMSHLDPLLAVVGPAKVKLSVAVHRTLCLESESRKAQLDELFQSQKRSAESEIRRAVADVQTRLLQIGLAKDKLEQTRNLLRRLQERREAKGIVQASEVIAAQLEVYRAESDAYQSVVAWKTATMKLKESQGLLAHECGYCLVATCCGECLK